jgi:hypothetical protein
MWRAYEPSESSPLKITTMGMPDHVSAAITSNQILAALFTNHVAEVGSQTTPFNTYFSWRIVASSPEISYPFPTPTTPANSTNTGPVGEDQMTPEVETADASMVLEQESVQPESGGGQDSGLFDFLDTDNDIMRLVISLLPVALFLLVIFGVGSWMLRKFRQ